MYKKILVAFDGSEGSQAALKHAAEIAEQHHSMLFIVHALKEKRAATSRPMYALPYGSSDSSGYLGKPEMDHPEEDTLKREGGAQVLEQARKKLKLPKSRIHTDILHGGEPAKEICDYASINEIELIVIGNRGLHGVRKLMLGSVSQKVAQHAHCPVMIVK